MRKLGRVFKITDICILKNVKFAVYMYYLVYDNVGLATIKLLIEKLDKNRTVNGVITNCNDTLPSWALIT